MDENERNALSSVHASRLRVVDKCVVDGAQLLHFVGDQVVRVTW